MNRPNRLLGLEHLDLRARLQLRDPRPSPWQERWLVARDYLLAFLIIYTVARLFTPVIDAAALLFLP